MTYDTCNRRRQHLHHHRFFENDKLVNSVRMSTDLSRTGDQYAADLYNLIKIEGIDFGVLREPWPRRSSRRSTRLLSLP